MKKLKIFEEMKEALEEALIYERGQQVNLRTAAIPAAGRKDVAIEIAPVSRKPLAPST